MDHKKYLDRREHAAMFLLSDQRNDDLVECLLTYREEIEKEAFGPIIEFINKHSQGKTWTKGMEGMQIVNHINYLRMHVESLSNHIGSLETRIKIQNGD